MEGNSGSKLTGSYNTALGESAGYSIGNGDSYNTAIGVLALPDGATSYSTAVGALAAYWVQSNHNTAVGYDAMYSTSASQLSGGYNTAVGDTALYCIQGAGANNTAVGYQAGYSGTALTTGTSNVYVGYNAAASAATDTNEIVIGASTTGLGSNTAIVGGSNTPNTQIGVHGVCHALYSFAVDGGTVGTLTPATNCTIPAKAVLFAATINSTTAVTSGGSATVAIGTNATGGSNTTFLAATPKASFSANALLNGSTTFAAPVKVTSSGTVRFTIATAALTAGVIEIWIQYYVATN
jgi:hypothetical protein